MNNLIIFYFLKRCVKLFLPHGLDMAQYHQILRHQFPKWEEKFAKMQKMLKIGVVKTHNFFFLENKGFGKITILSCSDLG